MQTPRGATVEQLHEAMLTGCRVSPHVHVLTSAETPVADITGVVEGGQVSWLHDGEVSRTLALNVVDPEHTLALDSNSPSDGAIYADRMVRVTQRFESDVFDDGWAEVDAFTGPMVKFTRTGAAVSLEMQSKEQRARTDVPALVLRKGMRTVDAIDKIMRERCGERRFAFPVADNADKLSKDVHVGRVEEQQPWTVCQNLAKSLGMQLFYDGRGVLVLRQAPSAPVMTLTPDSSTPELSHDWTQVYNRVTVKWSRKQGKKRVASQVEMTVDDLYPGHPFSPSNMGRNGVRWERTLVVDDEKIPTAQRAREVATRRLRDASMQQLDVRVSVVPAWHLDPLDVVALPDGTDFQWREASAQITGGPMQVGSVESVSRPRRR